MYYHYFKVCKNNSQMREKLKPKWQKRAIRLISGERNFSSKKGFFSAMNLQNF